MRTANNPDFTKLIYPDLSYKINGVLFAVHNELGRFRKEQQYADAIEGQFKKLNIKYEREKILPPSFESEVKGRNKVDFIVEDKIILELKSKKIITRDDYYQIQRYLQASNLKLGLLINFRQKYLSPKRIINYSNK